MLSIRSFLPQRRHGELHGDERAHVRGLGAMREGLRQLPVLARAGTDGLVVRASRRAAARGRDGAGAHYGNCSQIFLAS